MKIAVIGAGAMGGATVEGLIKGTFVNNNDIIVADPCKATLKRFADKGVATTDDNAKAASAADIVMVVVKPWLVETVLKGIRQSLDASRQTLIVIAAGVSSTNIREWVGDIPLFLAIPNIAIAELASMTFVVDATPQHTGHADEVKALFDSMGDTIFTDEAHLGSGTALASCGIAYALRYIRAASEGGVQLGFKADDATRIVAQTVKGAVSLLVSSGKHPEQLIDQVTTPGGVTIKGLNAMEEAGFSNAVIKGLVK
jgi:pyrroline-5-carboxylate reductase